MATASLPDPQDRARVAATVDAWVEGQRASDGPLLAGEQQVVTDGTASHRWHIRLRGEEKEVVTLWLSLHQRTLRHEAQVMPAPETNAEEAYTYLLRRNTDLYAMGFCLGPEDAVYLVGRVPAARVDADELDRIVGSSLAYVDDVFPTVMTIAHPWYRRPPRRRTPGGRP